MVTGAQACALVAMVARICARSPKYEAVKGQAEALAARADALREKMLRGKARDEQAFEAVVAAKGDRAAMQSALLEAAAVPLDGAQDALAALNLAAEAGSLQNKHLVSDVGCAAEFAYAALAACAYNVRINHKFMKDAEAIGAQRTQLERCEREGAAQLARVREAVAAQLAS